MYSRRVDIVNFKPVIPNNRYIDIDGRINTWEILYLNDEYILIEDTSVMIKNNKKSYSRINKKYFKEIIGISKLQNQSDWISYLQEMGYRHREVNILLQKIYDINSGKNDFLKWYLTANRSSINKYNKSYKLTFHPKEYKTINPMLILMFIDFLIIAFIVMKIVKNKI
ncbi:hypothetical protein NPA09_00200 [Mycoplasmopsis equigenitalium]|uniref:Uncharacterized protein n=1 Tax=Mycoplasmopsis equigenitalium TaxID=114883 RepID=A0ABY5J167_9BACT|nr:hypothetical protein [Mycoplasmopsis equigenitalium]UUD36989.1 hypothetical protein NPA09_00200 [Mycoplasmopsis equigenitalium]